MKSRKQNENGKYQTTGSDGTRQVGGRKMARQAGGAGLCARGLRDGACFKRRNLLKDCLHRVLVAVFRIDH
jgi:hypothetical protein